MKIPPRFKRQFPHKELPGIISSTLERPLDPLVDGHLQRLVGCYQKKREDTMMSDIYAWKFQEHLHDMMQIKIAF